MNSGTITTMGSTMALDPPPAFSSSAGRSRRHHQYSAPSTPRLTLPGHAAKPMLSALGLYAVSSTVNATSQGFSETGGFGALSVNAADANSFQTTLGRSASPRASRSGLYGTLIPELRLGWNHEFLDASQKITASSSALRECLLRDRHRCRAATPRRGRGVSAWSLPPTPRCSSITTAASAFHACRSIRSPAAQWRCGFKAERSGTATCTFVLPRRRSAAGPPMKVGHPHVRPGGGQGGRLWV